MTTTSNMGLTLIDAGTQEYVWSSNINANITIIDEHTHSSGNGLQLNVSIIQVLNNIDFDYNPITNLGYLNFYNNDTTISTYNSIFVENGDFYFKDGNGNDIQITSGSSLNISSITGFGFTGDYASQDFECYYDADDQQYSFLDSDLSPCIVVSNRLDCSSFSFTATEVYSFTFNGTSLNFNTATTSNAIGIAYSGSNLITTEIPYTWIIETDSTTSNIKNSLNMFSSTNYPYYLDTQNDYWVFAHAPYYITNAYMTYQQIITPSEYALDQQLLLENQYIAVQAAYSNSQLAQNYTLQYSTSGSGSLPGAITNLFSTVFARALPYDITQGYNLTYYVGVDPNFSTPSLNTATQKCVLITIIRDGNIPPNGFTNIIYIPVNITTPITVPSIFPIFWG